MGRVRRSGPGPGRHGQRPGAAGGERRDHPRVRGVGQRAQPADHGLSRGRQALRAGPGHRRPGVEPALRPGTARQRWHGPGPGHRPRRRGVHLGVGDHRRGARVRPGAGRERDLDPRRRRPAGVVHAGPRPAGHPLLRRVLPRPVLPPAHRDRGLRRPGRFPLAPGVGGGRERGLELVDLQVRGRRPHPDPAAAGPQQPDPGRAPRTGHESGLGAGHRAPAEREPEREPQPDHLQPRTERPEHPQRRRRAVPAPAGHGGCLDRADPGSVRGRCLLPRGPGPGGPRVLRDPADPGGAAGRAGHRRLDPGMGRRGRGPAPAPPQLARSALRRLAGHPLRRHRDDPDPRRPPPGTGG